MYGKHLPGAKPGITIITEGSRHFYFVNPEKVLTSNKTQIFERLSEEDETIMLSEILHYLAKGRILGPFPKNQKKFRKKPINLRKLFTIKKGD